MAKRVGDEHDPGSLVRIGEPGAITPPAARFVLPARGGHLFAALP